MHNLLETLRKAPGIVVMIIAIAISLATAPTTAAAVSSLVGRVEKLEAELGRAQAKLAELTASQAKLSASIDAADRSIKSLRSDLDHPQVRPLASSVNTGASLRQ